MTRLRRSFIAGCVIAVLVGGLSMVRAATPLAPLHTAGNQILDVNNAAVRLRGVTAGILNEYPYINTLTDVTPSSFDAAKSWGVNAVRVPLSEEFWFQSIGCRYPISPTDYQNNVATVVQRITSRGMLAILDLHVNTKTNTGWCNAAQQPMADYPRAITFWQQVANRFKTNPLVGFDLYNEPHDISWYVWRNGGTVLDFSGYWRAAGMQQMYDAVRGTGAQNLIFVSGSKWGTLPPPSAYLLSGYNIVYAAHAYTTTAPPSQILDPWTLLSLNNPMAVTEFGWHDNNSGAYNANVIAWAESHNVSWLAFIWNAGPNYALVTDLYSFKPTAAGVPVQNTLALHR